MFNNIPLITNRWEKMLMDTALLPVQLHKYTETKEYVSLKSLLTFFFSFSVYEHQMILLFF